MKRYGGGSFRKPVCVRTCLKNRILVPDRGGAEFQTAGILEYVEDLKRGTNKDMGPKDIFEMGSSSGTAKDARGYSSGDIKKKSKTGRTHNKLCP
jgi:hypothetical protein